MLVALQHRQACAIAPVTSLSRSTRRPLVRWANAYGSAILPAAPADASAAAAACVPSAPAYPSRTLSLSQRWEESFSNSSAWTSFQCASLKPAVAAAPPAAEPFPDRAASRGSTLSMSLSCDGSELASGHGDHSIRVWNLSTLQAQARHTLQGHARTPCQLQFHPKWPHLLASADLAGSVRVWDTALGHELARFECSKLPESQRAGQQKERVAGLSWFPSADQIVLGFVCKKRCWMWTMHQRAGHASSLHLIANLRASSKLVSELGSTNASVAVAAPPAPLATGFALGSKRDRAADATESSPDTSGFVDKKRKQEHQTAETTAATTSGIEVAAAASCSESSSPFTVSASPSSLSWSTLCQEIRSSLRGRNPSKPVCILKAECECASSS